MNKLKGTTQKQLFTEALQETLEFMSLYPAKLYQNSNVFNVDIDGEVVTITLPDTMLTKMEEV